MKTYIAIMMGKLAIIAGKLLHRGSVLPGIIALKFDKNIISHITLPKTIIAVTGSSGKTSTSYKIADILRKNGYSVIHNMAGSNLLTGIVTLFLNNTTLTGKSKHEIAVLEVDERYTKQIFDVIHPTHVIVNNITRDQPPRHGHFNVVYQTIASAIPKDTHLFLNGDDPMLLGLTKQQTGPITYFGLCKNKESFKTAFTNNPDMIYCPNCHAKLNYHFVSFGNVGDYACPKCDFKRPPLDYQITNINRNGLVINHQYQFKPTSDIIYTYYNDIAAFAVCHELSIPATDIITTLEHSSLREKRYLSFRYQERNGYILSGKNENAPSYNQSLLYVSKKKGIKTIIFGFEYISLRYPYQDISWLYDIDFELLKDETIDQVICLGPFAYDIATRIQLAGITKRKIKTVANVQDIYPMLSTSKGDIFAILNLGTDLKFKKQLEQQKIDVH